MKKYEKPTVYIERFELSQHIAACALDMPQQDKVETCYAIADTDNEIGYPPGVQAFASGVDGCLITDIEGYCYTNGTSGFNIFNS